MSASIPPPAEWLESRFDRAVRLKAAREDLLWQLARTRDQYRRATLTAHIETTTAALVRLGVPE